MLTSGAVDFLMDSAHQGNIRIETPELTLPYTTPDASHFRTEGWV